MYCADIDNLRDVLKMLAEVSMRWWELGLALGLKKSTLDEIYANYHHDVSSCKREMLSSWLKWMDDCKATCNWKSLAEALRDPTVNHAPIAGAIEKKYLVRMTRRFNNAYHPTYISTL